MDTAIYFVFSFALFGAMWFLSRPRPVVNEPKPETVKDGLAWRLNVDTKWSD